MPIQLSGSLEISGSIVATGGITISGSIASASFAENSLYLNGKDVNNFATTGSNLFNGNQVVTGSLTVTGQVIAQTLNVQQVTSSVVYSSGSNTFGNSIGNTQQFTGSVLVTGSLSVNGGINGTSVMVSGQVFNGGGLSLPDSTGTSTTNLFTRLKNTASGWVLDMGVNPYGGTPSGWIQARDSSNYATNSSLLLNPNGGNVGVGTSTPNGKFNVSNGGAEGIEIWVQSATATNLIQSYNRSTTAWNSLEYKAADHIFYGSGTERFRITSTGAATFNSTGSRMFLINTTTLSGAYIGWQTNGVDEFYIGKSNALGGGPGYYDIYSNSNGGGLRFFTDGSVNPRLTISTTGAATFNSSITAGGDIRTDGGTLKIGAGSNNYYSQIATAYNYPYMDSYFDAVSGVSYEGRLNFRVSSNGGALDIKMKLSNSGNLEVVGNLYARELYIRNIVSINNDNYPSTYPTQIGSATGAAGYVQLGNNSDNYIVGGSTAGGGNLRFYVNNTSILPASPDGLLALTINSAGSAIFNYSVVAVNFQSTNGRTYFAPGASRIENSNLVLDFGIDSTAGYMGTNYYSGGSYKKLILYAGGTTNQLVLNTDGSILMSSLGTGTVYSNAGVLTNTNPSDRNLKTNITPITYGLKDILKLNPVSYNWKDDTNTNKQFGFIAQEVQEVMPDAVVEGEYLGLEKDAIYASLVNAIKELTSRIEQLETK